jgi:hypothetical protein
MPYVKGIIPKQIDLGFILYANDYGGKYPMQVSTQNGGTMEFIYTDHVFPHFENSANTLSARTFSKYWFAPKIKPDKSPRIMKLSTI